MTTLIRPRESQTPIIRAKPVETSDLKLVLLSKVVGFSFLMWRIVWYTILVLGLSAALSIVLGLLLIVLPVPMLLFGIVAVFCPVYQKQVAAGPQGIGVTKSGWSTRRPEPVNGGGYFQSSPAVGWPSRAGAGLRGPVR